MEKCKKFFKMSKFDFQDFYFPQKFNFRNTFVGKLSTAGFGENKVL